MNWLALYRRPSARRLHIGTLGLPPTWGELDTLSAAPPAGMTGWGVAAEEVSPVDGAPAGIPRAGTGGVLAILPHRAAHLAWLPWCAAKGLDPRRATTRHVKRWLDDLAAQDVSSALARRMLASLSACYAYLADVDVVAANPAAFGRPRLNGPPPSTTHRRPRRQIGPAHLMSQHLRALLWCATGLPETRSSDDATFCSKFLRRRAAAVIALLTLGLTAAEVAELSENDLRSTPDGDVFHIRGSGGQYRTVYLTDLVTAALDGYLSHLDRSLSEIQRAVCVPDHRDRPLLHAQDRRARYRADNVNATLRRVGRHADARCGIPDRQMAVRDVRDAYITIALAHGVPVQYVEADLGESLLPAALRVDTGPRTRRTSAADVVAAAIGGSADQHAALLKHLRRS
jgi:site-specific recombinase XerD